MMTIVLAIKLEATEEATEGNEHVPELTHPVAVSVNKVTLPELLPKKDIKSEVWCHFCLRHEDRRPIKIDKLVCMLGFSNVTAKLYVRLKNKHPEEQIIYCNELNDERLKA